jgi:peptide/nickel transport system permease protein
MSGTPMRGNIARALDSDLFYSFRRSPVAVISTLVVVICVGAAALAPLLAPYNPFDLASLNLMDSFIPPAFLPDGSWAHVLGTDNQGRDLLSAMMYGARISLVIGLSAVVFAGVVGIVFGLAAGYAGGALDALLMRVADVQLTFPAILIALLVSGIVNVVLPSGLHERLEVYVLIFSIGISRWPQFARTVRSSTMVERGRDYVLAAQVIGLSGPRIVLTHILPNAWGPVVVIATINIGLSILDEATLSFLGIGLPSTQPSLGTLIRVGNDFLYSGEWWITIFPGVMLALMVLAINLLGDWLRDALNPRLK